MKKITLVLFALILSSNAFSQMRRDRMGNPIVNREPTDQEIERRKEEIEERKQEYINNFLSTLEADEFQKQIIKQTLESYFEAKIAIFKTEFEHSIDREKAVENLDETHFKELEELISESDMKKIRELIEGDFDEKEVKKKKKKKRKRKKNDKGE